MSSEQRIYNAKGKLLGTFLPANDKSESSGGGCLAVMVAIGLLCYLVGEGWLGIVKPTYHFVPREGVQTELLVDQMTFTKSRFGNSERVEGYFLCAVSDFDTIPFEGVWKDKLSIEIGDHDLSYNTFRSGEEMEISWEGGEFMIENRNPLSEKFGEFESWSGGMDDVQFWMALVLVVLVGWILRILVVRLL